MKTQKSFFELNGGTYGRQAYDRRADRGKDGSNLSPYITANQKCGGINTSRQTPGNHSIGWFPGVFLYCLPRKRKVCSFTHLDK